MDCVMFQIDDCVCCDTLTIWECGNCDFQFAENVNWNIATQEKCPRCQAPILEWVPLPTGE